MSMMRCDNCDKLIDTDYDVEHLDECRPMELDAQKQKEICEHEYVEDDKTYKIVRFYADDSHPDHRKVIKTGLTLEEAQEHCNDEDTHEPGIWFDGYTEE